MLRAMGGGITAAGGQKMRNGVPIFEGGDNPGDDEGQGGAPASESSSGPSEAAAGDEASGAVDAEIAAQELMSGPEMDPSVPIDPGIMGIGRSLVSKGLPATAAGYFGFGKQSQVGIQALMTGLGLFGGVPALAAMSIPSLVENAIDAFPGLDVDYGTEDEQDEDPFAQ